MRKRTENRVSVTNKIPYEIVMLGGLNLKSFSIILESGFAGDAGAMLQQMILEVAQMPTKRLCGFVEYLGSRGEEYLDFSTKKSDFILAPKTINKIIENLLFLNVDEKSFERLINDELWVQRAFLIYLVASWSRLSGEYTSILSTTEFVKGMRRTNSSMGGRPNKLDRVILSVDKIISHEREKIWELLRANSSKGVIDIFGGESDLGLGSKQRQINDHVNFISIQLALSTNRIMKQTLTFHPKVAKARNLSELSATEIDKILGGLYTEIDATMQNYVARIRENFFGVLKGGVTEQMSRRLQ